MSTPRELAFDDFRLHPVEGRLTRAGTPVELRPKSFEVLLHLARHPGALVTKEQLMAAVWPGVVVTDDSLVQCVGEVRQAIGDREQAFIRTVPRRGYVFTREVRVVEPQGPRAQPARSRLARGAWAVVAAAGLAVAAALLWIATHGPAAPPPPLSIVVLPLELLDDDPAQAWFARGFAEDLTTDLSRIPSSFVIAYSTAESYGGKAPDVRAIGRELGVRYVLQGSIRRLGEVVRLNVRLLETETGREAWADRLDGAADDLAGLQARLTGTLARTLDLELLDAEVKRAGRGGARTPAIRDLELRAWSLYEARTAPSVEEARRIVEGIAEDDRSAFAWSLLSDTYTADVLNRWLQLRGATRERWRAAAEAAADRAYALDPSNLYVLGSRATVLQLAGRHEQAAALFERQIAINRNYAPAWHRLSYSQIALGRPRDALRSGQEAIRLSPRDGRLYSFYAVMAAAALFDGRDAEALAWAQKSAAARADFGTAYSWVAASAALLGREDAARAALAEFRRLQPDYTIATFRSEGISDNPEFLRQRERYLEGLRRAGLPE